MSQSMHVHLKSQVIVLLNSKQEKGESLNQKGQCGKKFWQFTASAVLVTA